jgi:hypothetical protein
MAQVAAPNAPVNVDENVQILMQHVKDLSGIKDGLAIGNTLLELEANLGKRFIDFLKENFPVDIVRYLRNLTMQAKLVEKVPALRDKVLSLPLSHTAVLLTATQQQIEEILMSGVKWTIALIKEKVSSRLISGKPVTERDWKIVQERLDLNDSDIAQFRVQAESEEVELTTDRLCSLLKKAGYKVTKLLKKLKARAKSPIPEDLAGLILDRDSLKMEYERCVEEGAAKEVLRQELNKANRAIAELTGIDRDPVVDQLFEENQQLKQQLAHQIATATAIEETEVPEKVTNAVIVQEPDSKKKRPTAAKNNSSLGAVFDKLAVKLVSEFMPKVTNTPTVEWQQHLKLFLSEFQSEFQNS